MPATPLKLGVASPVRAPSTGEERVSPGSAGLTTQVTDAGVASVFPAGSVARTWKVWEPALRPGSGCGDEQVAQAPPSSRHWKVASVSVESKRKSAEVVPVTAAGVWVNSVLGAVRSTRKLCAALMPTLLAPSACSA